MKKCEFFGKGCQIEADSCQQADDYHKNCPAWIGNARKLLEENKKLCPLAVFGGYTNALCDEPEAREKFYPGFCYEGEVCLARNLPEVQKKHERRFLISGRTAQL